MYEKLRQKQNLFMSFNELYIIFFYLANYICHHLRAYYFICIFINFQTMKNRMWSQIARELELPKTMTSGAFTLKLK